MEKATRPWETATSTSQPCLPTGMWSRHMEGWIRRILRWRPTYTVSFIESSTSYIVSSQSNSGVYERFCPQNSQRSWLSYGSSLMNYYFYRHFRVHRSESSWWISNTDKLKLHKNCDFHQEWNKQMNAFVYMIWNLTIPIMFNNFTIK